MFWYLVLLHVQYLFFRIYHESQDAELSSKNLNLDGLKKKKKRFKKVAMFKQVFKG